MLLRKRDELIQLKTPAQIAVMREAGLVVASALRAVTDAIEPGISTAELDAIAAQAIRSAGAAPSFLGYHGYPACICTSVNEQIVHGIPSRAQVLAAGDLISVDCGAVVGGYHGDAAVTVGVGELSQPLTDLARACEQALRAGIAQARPGGRLTDISHAIEQSVLASGTSPGEAAGADVPARYGIIREYTGHGIGTRMHMPPAVPNYGRPGRGPRLAEGMALAIEPMLVLGSPVTRMLADGWTVVAADGSSAAHFEHSVAITADGPVVLTAPADGEPGQGVADGG